MSGDGEIYAFKNQVYEDLKSRHNEHNLFEDDKFPANDSSLFYSQRPPAGIKWLRPKEARQNAAFVVNGFDHCDMDQGQVGNCWFIAGAVGIMQSPKLFAKVVPSDQSLTDNYAGIFHFRFWQYGQWVDVVIDDRLPYLPDGRLLFCSNRQEPNEYWAPLLEKAYAKLYGCYESLDAGQTYDALVDMSGGIQENFDLKKLNDSEKSNFWKIVYNGFEKNAILGCSINADPATREARMSCGLVRGHAYTITKIANLNGEELLRIRNPWGNEVEWNGAWSDNSSEWMSISESQRQELGLNKEKDGEFWMNYSDFMHYWDNVQICHLTPDSFSSELFETDNDSDIMWKCKIFQSEWRAGSTAGGCGNGNQAKFWTNPQFLIKLTDVDRDDNENMATVIIALMQKDSRLKRVKTRTDSAEEFIQFKIFKVKDGVAVDENQSSGLRLYASQLDRIGASGSYINSREVTKRFRVEPGNYLIIPSTYEEDKNCEFMLRVFTEQQIDSGSLDEHKDPHDLNDDDIHVEKTNDDLIKRWIKLLDPKIYKGANGQIDMNKVISNVGPAFKHTFIDSGFASGFASGFGSNLNKGFGQAISSGFNSAFGKLNKGGGGGLGGIKSFLKSEFEFTDLSSACDNISYQSNQYYQEYQENHEQTEENEEEEEEEE